MEECELSCGLLSNTVLVQTTFVPDTNRFTVDHLRDNSQHRIYFACYSHGILYTSDEFIFSTLANNSDDALSTSKSEIDINVKPPTSTVLPPIVSDEIARMLVAADDYDSVAGIVLGIIAAVVVVIGGYYLVRNLIFYNVRRQHLQYEPQVSEPSTTAGRSSSQTDSHI
jgi:hypothetical protein